MIATLQEKLKNKKFIVFDFDRTLAKMEIDWSDWHTGIAEVYAKFDQNHGYEYGKNPHTYHNKLVKQFGDSLLQEIRAFNQDYEARYLTGFTPNTELVDFVTSNKTHTLYVYSSNSRPTVMRGLNELGIANAFAKIISKDEVVYVKPDPEGFYLIENFENNTEHFLMIGDSGSDRGAASAAGIDFLLCDLFEKYVEEE